MKIFGKIFFFLSFLTLGVSESDFDSSKNTSHQITGKTLDDWCSLTCGPEKYKNIVCEMGGKCQAEFPCKFEIDKIKILEEHNILRNKFAAGEETRVGGVQVANLVALEWDEDLAFIASCNLAKCGPAEYDLCHTTPKFRNIVGQNLWSHTFKTASDGDCVRESNKAVQHWYDEVNLLTEEKVRAAANSYKFDNTISHFTQLIWAKTTHVGCALVKNDVGDQTTCVMACNYGPGGNILGGRMFEEGRPCSLCSDNLECGEVFDALCVGGRLRSNQVEGLHSNIDLMFISIFMVNYSFVK